MAGKCVVARGLWGVARSKLSVCMQWARIAAGSSRDFDPSYERPAEFLCNVFPVDVQLTASYSHTDNNYSPRDFYKRAVFFWKHLSRLSSDKCTDSRLRRLLRGHNHVHLNLAVKNPKHIHKTVHLRMHFVLFKENNQLTDKGVVGQITIKLYNNVKFMHIDCKTVDITSRSYLTLHNILAPLMSKRKGWSRLKSELNLNASSL